MFKLHDDLLLVLICNHILTPFRKLFKIIQLIFVCVLLLSPEQDYATLLHNFSAYLVFLSLAYSPAEFGRILGGPGT